MLRWVSWILFGPRFFYGLPINNLLTYLKLVFVHTVLGLGQKDRISRLRTLGSETGMDGPGKRRYLLGHRQE